MTTKKTHKEVSLMKHTKINTIKKNTDKEEMWNFDLTKEAVNKVKRQTSINKENIFITYLTTKDLTSMSQKIKVSEGKPKNPIEK